MADARVLPRSLYTAAQVRAMDSRVIETCDTSGLELMERAGEAALGSLRRQWPKARHILVVCGLGNNAGDGYIVARRAASAGLTVQLVQVGDRAALKGDAKLACARLGSAVRVVSSPEVGTDCAADVIVDALFGTGLSRPVAGEWLAAIQFMNGAPAPVVALDVPSGLDSDTGAVHGVAVEAALSTSFVALKQGMFTGLGPHHCGTVEHYDLEIPGKITTTIPASAQRIHSEDLSSLLSPRPRQFHKGNCGHVLAAGGDHGFAGAIRLCAEAAARVGSGLVTVVTRERHVDALVAARPELMWRAVEDEAALADALGRCTVVAVGPGLGRSSWSKLVWHALRHQPRPLVVDADALNALAADEQHRDDWILTPHPGEAARLLGLETAEVQANRFDAVSALVARYGGVVVLKGSGTLVAKRGCVTSVCVQGNPGMASGGMGDVLTGVIAGLLAQGLGLWDAARLGVCLHAGAADAAATVGERGLLAMDLMAQLRALANPSPG